MLAIVHQRDAGPGVFAEAVAEAGGELDEWFIAEAGEPPLTRRPTTRRGGGRPGVELYVWDRGGSDN